MRLVADGAAVVTDPDGTRPGRGAYVCDATCLATAVERRALARAFRRAVTLDDKTLESVRT